VNISLDNSSCWFITFSAASISKSTRYCWFLGSIVNTLIKVVILLSIILVWSYWFSEIKHNIISLDIYLLDQKDNIINRFLDPEI
jgi:hypothetical protein